MSDGKNDEAWQPKNGWSLQYIDGFEDLTFEQQYHLMEQHQQEILAIAAKVVPEQRETYLAIATEYRARMNDALGKHQHELDSQHASVMADLTRQSIAIAERQATQSEGVKHATWVLVAATVVLAIATVALIFATLATR